MSSESDNPDPDKNKQLLNDGHNWIHDVAQLRLSVQIQAFGKNLSEEIKLFEIARGQYLPLQDSLKYLTIKTYKITEILNIIQTGEKGKPQHSTLAIVKSDTRCGLGPIISTNPNENSLNMMWDICQNSHLTTIVFYEDENIAGKAYIAFERNTNQDQIKSAIRSYQQLARLGEHMKINFLVGEATNQKGRRETHILLIDWPADNWSPADKTEAIKVGKRWAAKMTDNPVKG